MKQNENCNCPQFFNSQISEKVVCIFSSFMYRDVFANPFLFHFIFSRSTRNLTKRQFWKYFSSTSEIMHYYINHIKSQCYTQRKSVVDKIWILFSFYDYFSKTTYNTVKASNRKSNDLWWQHNLQQSRMLLYCNPDQKEYGHWRKSCRKQGAAGKMAAQPKDNIVQKVVQGLTYRFIRNMVLA